MLHRTIVPLVHWTAGDLPFVMAVILAQLRPRVHFSSSAECAVWVSLQVFGTAKNLKLYSGYWNIAP